MKKISVDHNAVDKGLNNVLCTYDRRNFLMPVRSHEKYDAANELRLIYSIDYTFTDFGEEFVYSDFTFKKQQAYRHLNERSQLVKVQSLPA